MRAAQENSRDVDQLDSVNAIASSFKHVAMADPKKIDMTLQLQSMSATGLAEAAIHASGCAPSVERQPDTPLKSQSQGVPSNARVSELGLVTPQPQRAVATPPSGVVSLDPYSQGLAQSEPAALG